MSTAVVSTSATEGRPFFFDDEALTEGSCGDSRPRLSGRAQLDRRSPENQPQPGIPSKILPSSVIPASRLEIRPAPEMVSSGIPAIDALTGGLPRGCLTEICGPASSGRTSFLLAALAAATHRGEFCTLVDASDALDPHSADSAGVALDRLLWVRCGDPLPPKNNSPQRHRDTEKTKDSKSGCAILAAPFAARAGTEQAKRVEGVGISSKFLPNADPQNSRASERRLEQVLRATDLLLESGGFGLIVLDLADLPPQAARRIPLTTWFRFHRAIEHTPTILLAIEQHPIAGSCSSLLLQLGAPNNSEESMRWAQSNFSREAALWESPARQCRVGMKKENESRRDGTEQAKRAEGDGTDFIETNNATHDVDDAPQIANHPTHAHLLTGLNINAELIRSRHDRKPARSIAFATQTAWTG